MGWAFACRGDDRAVESGWVWEARWPLPHSSRSPQPSLITLPFPSLNRNSPYQGHPGPASLHPVRSSGQISALIWHHFQWHPTLDFCFLSEASCPFVKMTSTLPGFLPNLYLRLWLLAWTPNSYTLPPVQDIPQIWSFHTVKCFTYSLTPCTSQQTVTWSLLPLLPFHSQFSLELSECSL